MHEAPKPPRVLMESIADHTYDGIPRPVGTQYEVDDQYVDFLELVGRYAKRVDKPADKPPAKSTSHK